ncbi:MAG: ATP-binding cassette domain-containing protein [Rhodobacterales bacterium]|nr:ATP-binding cassette domain-containing protein [Rhodobacterales bacterium]
MLVIQNLAKAFGGRTLFSDVNLRLDPGKVYGVVGANGSGKSTLLRIMTGEESASAGEVTIPKKVRVGVLEQNHFKYEEVRILDVVMMGHKELWAAMSESETMCNGPDADFDVDRYGQLQETIEQMGGYQLEAHAAEVLNGLNIETAKHDLPLSTLSGGYKLRVLLAQVLASTPDLLLLDEPTNHLDIVSLDWLEGFLRTFKGCVAVVSHDQLFLDNVCTNIIDVDYQLVQVYKGNYSAFGQAKIDEMDRREGEIGKREKEIETHKAFIARFKAKASKARQANSRVKRLAKISLEKLPVSSRRYPSFKFIQRRNSGREGLKIKEVGKIYDDNIVLNDVTINIGRGEKVAIIGPNGIGKSTLLKICMGEVKADGGTTDWGHEAHIGYFEQDHADLFAGNGDLQSWLWDKFPSETMGFVRGKLAEVLFTQDDAEKRISALSGGEKARMVFCMLGARQPNVLVLDEPTNHLDIEGIEALSSGLKKFEGTLLFVSHNRWFVNELATRVVEISPEGVFDFHGTYGEYAAYKRADHLDVAAVLATDAEKRRKTKREKKKNKQARK